MNKAGPFFSCGMGASLVQIGAAADNILNGNAPPQLVRQLLEARLQSELRGKVGARHFRNRNRSRLEPSAESRH